MKHHPITFRFHEYPDASASASSSLSASACGLGSSDPRWTANHGKIHQNVMVYHCFRLNFLSFGMSKGMFLVLSIRFQTHPPAKRPKPLGLATQTSPGFRTGDDGTVPRSCGWCNRSEPENRAFTPSTSLFMANFMAIFMAK